MNMDIGKMVSIKKSGFIQKKQKMMNEQCVG